MANEMTMSCRGNLTTFSINRITEAIDEAVKGACLDHSGNLILIESSEFGGTTSAAFREGLVKEYNVAHTKACPKCGHTLYPTLAGTADCRYCKTRYTFPKEGAELCFVSEEGIAEFIGRKLANGFANRTGDCYHLGSVGGITLYYGTSPNRQFYAKHKGDSIALVLGSNNAEVPENWNGRLVPLCELFYLNEATGDIRISKNRLRDLLPGVKTNRLSTGERKFNKFRLQWLMFFANLLSAPYKPTDFWCGRLRPRVPQEWFVKNVQEAPGSVKQYQRQLRDFRHFKKGAGKSDKREQFIALLLRTAADKKLSVKERLSIAKTIPELVAYLQRGEHRNNGRPIEITRGAWQYCLDNTKEYVAVTDIDRFFDELDERDVCSA